MGNVEVNMGKLGGNIKSRLVLANYIIKNRANGANFASESLEYAFFETISVVYGPMAVMFAGFCGSEAMHGPSTDLLGGLGSFT